MSFYDVCKMLGQTIFPAILTFIGVLSTDLGWQNTELIMKIGTAFITMWNSIIIVWNKEYYKEMALKTTEVQEDTTDEEGVAE